MATMTMLEANHILDIIFKELQDTSHRHRPVSALEGYDICQIDSAVKLQIANKFLHCALKSNPVECFADAMKVYGLAIGVVTLNFVPDDQVDDIGAESVFGLDPDYTYKDKRIGSLETESSFANY